MIQIFVSECSEQEGVTQYEQLKKYYTRNYVDRIVKSKSDLFRLRRISSGLAWIKICTDLFQDCTVLKKMYHNKSGKLVYPHFGYHFTVSYTSTKILCAVSDHSVGVDIEDIQSHVDKKSIDVLEKLTKREYKTKLEFFKEWTRLESIVKIFDDKGLGAVLLKGINDDDYHSKQLILENRFLITISGKKLDRDLKITKLKLQ